MGVERCADLLAHRQFVYFTSMIAALKEIAVLLKAQIYWPRPERLAHRTSHHE
jgi:hypothetical protein